MLRYHNTWYINVTLNFSITNILEYSIDYCPISVSCVVGPYEEVITADGIVEEYFAFDATLVLPIIIKLLCNIILL